MFSIGLYLSEPARALEAMVDPFLLSRKFSYSGFLKYALGGFCGAPAPKSASPLLFPELSYLDVWTITNTFCGPVACAADDLELSLAGGPDQIEFFDNYFNGNSTGPRDKFHPPQGPYGDHYDTHGDVTSQSAMGSSYDMPAFPDVSPTGSLSLQQPLSLLLSFHFDNPAEGYGSKQQLPYFQIQSQPLPHHNFFPELAAQSHFALNMIGVQSYPDFNDFKHSVHGSDGVSMYGSSSESYASPLDEMFFKKPSADMRPSIVESNIAKEEQSMIRKRKHKGSSPLASESQYFSEVFYEERGTYEDRETGCDSSELELPCNLKFEPSKKMRLDSVSETVIKTEDGSKTEFKFKCPQCDAGFKVKSYLTRHMRKHNNAKAFVCPFFEETEVEDGGSVAKNGTKCHPTGGFSRRDTYKTHLKALHFIYPPGTKSTERNTTGGRCAGCFEFFDSNIDWLKDHIEGGACKGTVGNGRVTVKQEPN